MVFQRIVQRGVELGIGADAEQGFQGQHVPLRLARLALADRVEIEQGIPRRIEEGLHGACPELGDEAVAALQPCPVVERVSLDDGCDERIGPCRHPRIGLRRQPVDPGGVDVLAEDRRRRGEGGVEEPELPAAAAGAGRAVAPSVGHRVEPAEIARPEGSLHLGLDRVALRRLVGGREAGRGKQAQEEEKGTQHRSIP